MGNRLELIPLLLILFLSFLVSPLLSHMRWLSVVVGKIVVGIVIGRIGGSPSRQRGTVLLEDQV
ncbi:MAG: hypothetical protein ACPLRX_02750 [Candidatus Saccharicenans sp.]